MIFILLICFLVIIAWLFILPKLISNKKITTIQQQHQLVAATKKQLQALKRDLQQGLLTESQFSKAKNELESTLALELEGHNSGDDPSHESGVELANQHQPSYLISTIGVSLFIPIAALIIYLLTGTPQALDPKNRAVAADNSLFDVQQMLDRLEQQAIDKPEDIKAQHVLAKTYMILRRYALAAERYAQLVDVEPNNAAYLVGYADALAMNNDGHFTPQSSQLVRDALEIDPNHPQALWLAGMNAVEVQDHRAAVDYFRKAKKVMREPESLAELDRLIARASGNATEDINLGKPLPNQALATVGVIVNVTIDAVLRQQLTGNETVFILATNPASKAPAAVTRVQVSQLPIQITLDDSKAMLPSHKISLFDSITITARVSKGGGPIAQQGDLFQTRVNVNPQNMPTVNLTINQVVE